MAALAEAGEDAKVLAGGQSLIPLMNFRLARPGIIIDLNLLTELSSFREQDGWLTLGSMTRQRDVEMSPIVKERYPILAAAIRHIGHVQIRTRGTVGGSLAHADPSAELPAVALTLGAQIEAHSTRGSRVINSEEFFLGPFWTSLAADEILTSIRIPRLEGWRTAFVEFARRTGDFGLAGVAVAAQLGGDQGTVVDLRIGALGVGPTPLRLTAVEQFVRGTDLSDTSLDIASRLAAEEVDPPDDIHADAGYRRKLVGHLVRQALQQVAA